MKLRWLLGCALGLGILGTAQAQEVQHPAVLSAAGGRFVFGQVNGYARHQYMLDTQTGRLWQVVCLERQSTECNRSVLQTVTYWDPNVGESDLPLAPMVPVKKPDPPPTKNGK